MRPHIRRRRSISARWSVRIAFLGLILFVLSGLGHRFERIETPEFLWLLAIVAGLALLALLLSLKGFTSVWRRGDMGFPSAFWGMMIAFVVLAPFATTLYQALMLPRIYDISTDITDPPELFAAGQRTERMNPVVNDEDSRALQSSAYPQVTGRRYDGSPDRILTAINKVIAANGWTVVAQKGEPGVDEEILLEVVARTFLLGFTSDAVIRLSDEGETTYVDMRSVSRYGSMISARMPTASLPSWRRSMRKCRAPSRKKKRPSRRSRVLHRCPYLSPCGRESDFSILASLAKC